jgi:hypothetical protein
VENIDEFDSEREFGTALIKTKQIFLVKVPHFHFI